MAEFFNIVGAQLDSYEELLRIFIQVAFLIFFQSFLLMLDDFFYVWGRHYKQSALRRSAVLPLQRLNALYGAPDMGLST